MSKEKETKKENNDKNVEIKPTTSKIAMMTPTGDDKFWSGHVRSLIDVYSNIPANQIFRIAATGSVLTRNFNFMFREIVRLKKEEHKDLKYMVIFHSDIEIANPNWLNIMIGVMEDQKVDVMSLPMIVKNPEQRSSFVLRKPDPKDEYEFFVFGTQQLGELEEKGINLFDDPNLLYNTGVMVVNMDSPAFKKVVEENDVYFTITEGLTQSGTLGMFSEDWYFGELMRKAGANMKMYLDLPTVHYGTCGWTLNKSRAGICNSPSGWHLGLKAPINAGGVRDIEDIKKRVSKGDKKKK